MRTSNLPAATFCLLIILISAGTLFFRLGSLPFLGADEPRYARIAEEMYNTGRWITPTLEGVPWLEKPPLYYWFTTAIQALLGANEFTARLGSALCALMAALSLLWLGSRLEMPLAGFFGAAILLTSLGFCGFGRSASTDMPMAACFTVALSILVVRVTREDFGPWKAWIAYFFIGLAILAKGPVALLLAVGIAILFWLLDERGNFWNRWQILPGLLITVTVSAPWFWLAFRENGYSFILVFFINHNLSRYVSDIHHHTEPFYYFIPVMLGLLFPWTGWLPALIQGSTVEKLRAWRNWNPATLFLLCWFAFPFLFFSISQSKLAGYILPSVPPLALLLGMRLAGIFRGEVRSATRVIPWLHLILTIGVAFAIPWLMHTNYGENWKFGLPLATVALIPGVMVFWLTRKSNWSTAVRITVLQGVILVLAVTQFGFPLLARHHSTEQIARQAISARTANEPIVTYRVFHHTLFYYTGYEIEEQLQEEGDLMGFALLHPNFLLVTEATSLGDLRRIEGFSVSVLATQGKLYLIRIKHY